MKTLAIFSSVALMILASSFAHANSNVAYCIYDCADSGRVVAYSKKDVVEQCLNSYAPETLEEIEALTVELKKKVVVCQQQRS
jgi:Skp family chaperone for outer membrane proteins